MKLRYHLLDVFTDRAFGGNPLAVFPDGNGIPDALMQSLANELNLSETTFVLPADHEQHDCRVRIFTPRSELAMAGHPTIGTAFVLAREGVLTKSQVVFEEGVGPVPVTLEWKNGAPAYIEMRQPLPTFGPRFDPDAVAQMLSIERSAIVDLPCEIVSCGNPFVFVPIETLAAIRQIRFRSDIAERLIAGTGAKGVFVFTRETEQTIAQVHGRLFAPFEGIAEDPATGSAAGPLGSYLVHYGAMKSDGELAAAMEQGMEIGRPSLLHFRIAHSGHQITGVRVGGTCHYMGAGQFEIPQ